jgi:hypothetical protein
MDANKELHGSEDVITNYAEEVKQIELEGMSAR